MKALVLTEYNHFEYKEMPDPIIGNDDVLVAVRACGICGSDVHGMDGSTGRRRPPIIMGHEAAGIIEAVGTHVKGWKKGDRVTFDSTIYCNACAFCRRGMINLCDHRRVLGVSCAEYRRDGAFADYVTIPAHILYRLPNHVSFEQAAGVEALAIAVHAVERCPRTLGDSAVVIGAGMIGLLILQVLRTAGYGKILVVDVSRSRLELAARLGADLCCHAMETDVASEIRHLTGGRGASCVFEAVGFGETLKTAVACTAKGGNLVLVGNLKPVVELPLQSVVTGQLTLHGSCASAGEYPVALEMMAGRKINLDALLSAVEPLSKGALWFDRLYRKESELLKVVLRPAEKG